jgi:hypothetical protein
MNRTPFVQALLAILSVSFTSVAFAARYQESSASQPRKVLSFDVLDLPARIDEPELRKNADGYVLTCAVANRSSEGLLGIRLIVMIIDASGKMKMRTTWTEAVELSANSIKTFEFHPAIKEAFRNTDQLFLVVEEVISRETIWRAVDADKALRAYSRGQHDVIPRVQSVANKFDPPSRAIVIYQENRQ